MFGVYRISANGNRRYVSRSATHSEKLAMDIAADLSAGRMIMSDGSTRHIKPRPHIAAPIGEK